MVLDGPVPPGTVVALGASLAPVASAPADSRVPAKQKLAIVGRSEFKINKLAFDNQRFSRTAFAIRSGGVVTLVNRAKTEDPHTISLVENAQLPKTFDCEVCGEVFGAHGAGARL